MDSVIHLAAISNDPMGKQFERITNEINYQSSISLAKLSAKSGVSNYVFASSCSVYGTASLEPKNESASLNPLTEYARSKINTEIDLKNLATDKFKVTCLRFATACGFTPRTRLDLVLNDFVASALLTKNIEILSDGSPLRPLIHVKDMARAIDWASQRKVGTNFLTLNAGSNDWNYQIKDLAENVSDLIPNVSLSINKDAPPDKRSYRVDFNNFNNIVPSKYHPKISLKEAINTLADGISRMDIGENFRDSRFIRLNVLKNLIKKEEDFRRP